MMKRDTKRRRHSVSNSHDKEKPSFVILPRGAELPQVSSYHLRQKRNRSPLNDTQSCDEQINYSSSASASSSDEVKSECSYAGAGFHSPPAADLLPPPPMHWMKADQIAVNPSLLSYHLNQALSVSALTTHIKGLLKVPVQA